MRVQRNTRQTRRAARLSRRKRQDRRSHFPGVPRGLGGRNPKAVKRANRALLSGFGVSSARLDRWGL